MGFFEWDESLDVGVEEMNAQHKVLISLMNIVHEKDEMKAAKTEIEVAIYNLIDYVEKHFDDEEKYMESVNFAGIDAHKKLHKNLVSDLKNYAEEYAENEEPHISSAFTTFLKVWLTTHIKGVDTRYYLCRRQ